MKNLKDTLHEVGFSNELIDAISATPQLESQENNVDNICYQTFKNDNIMIEDPDLYSKEPEESTNSTEPEISEEQEEPEEQEPPKKKKGN